MVSLSRKDAYDECKKNLHAISRGSWIPVGKVHPHDFSEHYLKEGDIQITYALFPLRLWGLKPKSILALAVAQSQEFLVFLHLRQT